MTLTRANVESILYRRRGNMMSAAGLSTAVDGTNVDMNDPIGYGIRWTGGTTASPASVTDADVATVTDDDLDELLDVAEWRLLLNIKGNLDQVDIVTGPMSEKLSQLGQSVKEDLDKITQWVTDQYGIISVESGSIGLDIADHNENLFGSV